MLTAIWNRKSWSDTYRNYKALCMLQETKLVRVARRQRRGTGQEEFSVVDYAVTPYPLDELARGWEWCHYFTGGFIALEEWHQLKALVVEQLIP